MEKGWESCAESQSATARMAGQAGLQWEPAVMPGYLLRSFKLTLPRTTMTDLVCRSKGDLVEALSIRASLLRRKLTNLAAKRATRGKDVEHDRVLLIAANAYLPALVTLRRQVEAFDRNAALDAELRAEDTAAEEEEECEGEVVVIHDVDRGGHAELLGGGGLVANTELLGAAAGSAAGGAARASVASASSASATAAAAAAAAAAAEGGAGYETATGGADGGSRVRCQCEACRLPWMNQTCLHGGWVPVAAETGVECMSDVIFQWTSATKAPMGEEGERRGEGEG